MTSEFIAEAGRIIERLRELDKRCLVFGAVRHRYRFGPRLPKDLLADFESRHGIELPAPYRAFLAELGNGGAGPYYGIAPLSQTVEHVKRPFVHSQAFEVPPDELGELLDGAVELAEYGCGVFVLLVLNGDAAGQVWVDARYEGGVSPVERDGQIASFDRWWLSSMTTHLDLFEQVFAMMNAGAEHEAIHAALDPHNLELHVDEAMLSIMDCDPAGKPKVAADKPWGRACGLADEQYEIWRETSGASGSA